VEEFFRLPAAQTAAAVEKLREEAGCFVLLTYVPVEEKVANDVFL
jgi:hypothetical protein